MRSCSVVGSVFGGVSSSVACLGFSQSVDGGKLLKLCSKTPPQKFLFSLSRLGLRGGCEIPRYLLSSEATLLNASLAPGTKQAYERYLNLFRRFIQNTWPSVVPDPTLIDQVYWFICHLASEGAKPNTVQVAISAIVHASQAVGAGNHWRDFRIKQLFRGIQRGQASEDNRLPLSLCDLHAILNVVSVSVDWEKRVCLLAALSTAYFALLRIGEYCADNSAGSGRHCLQRESVRELSDGSFLLTIKSSKAGVPGREVVVAIKPRQGDRFCPSKLLSSYLRIRGATPGPLFKIKDVALTKTVLASELERAARAAGLDANRVKPHSLRIGGATMALQSGLSDAQVRALGRWRSDAFLRYLRPTL